MTKHSSRGTCDKHPQGLRQRLDSFTLLQHVFSVYEFGLDLCKHCLWVFLSSLYYKRAARRVEIMITRARLGKQGTLHAIILLRPCFGIKAARTV